MQARGRAEGHHIEVVACEHLPILRVHRDLFLDLLTRLQEACGREDVDLALLNPAGPIFRDRVRTVFSSRSIPRSARAWRASEKLAWRTVCRVTSL
jgi:hypothetical protein